MCGDRRMRSRPWAGRVRGISLMGSAGGRGGRMRGGAARRDDAAARELGRPRRGGNRRVSLVGSRARARDSSARLASAAAARAWIRRVVAVRRILPRGGTCPDAVAATVVAHAVHGDIVDGDVPDVHVGDVGGADVDHGTVVEQTAVLPVAAVEAAAAVTVAIVHAPVEADLGTPESRVPQEYRSLGAPIARCPEQSRLRRLDPGAGDPSSSPGRRRSSTNSRGPTDNRRPEWAAARTPARPGARDRPRCSRRAGPWRGPAMPPETVRIPSAVPVARACPWPPSSVAKQYRPPPERGASAGSRPLP